MTTRPIYARIPDELHEQLGQNKRPNESMSSAIERLIRTGISNISSENELTSVRQELVPLKDKVVALEKERAELQGSKEALHGQLQACKAKESIALAAQSHVAELQQQVQTLNSQNERLRDYLQTPVATCGTCHNQLVLFDIGQAKCRYCGNWHPTWLAAWTPPPTTWEIVKDGAAVIGAVTVVSALLNALGNSGRE